MKKFALTAIAAAMLSTAAVAADSHTRWEGSVDKFTGTITNKAQFDDVIKYTDYATQAKLKASFADGKLTAEEIKASGISDHHFYTGLLASSKSQAEYDKYLKQLNGGANVDDNFVSNRDLKAAGSMIMNQVDAGNKVQDTRMDKIVAGLKDWTSSFYPTNPDLPEDGQEVPETSRPDQGVDRPFPGTGVERPEAQPDVDNNFGQGHLPDYGQEVPEVDNDFGQNHLPGFGNGEALDPETDEGFGQGHLPDYGQNGDIDRPFPGQGERPEAQPPVDENFGQGHHPDFGQDVPEVDNGFGQNHLPGFGNGEALDSEVDNGFGQGHTPDFGQGEALDPETDEGFGQGHLPDYGNGNGSNSGDIDRPFPGQGERPEAQPPVDDSFGQGHLPDYGQGGDVDRPFPGQGDRPVPQPPVDEDFGQGHVPDYGQDGDIDRPFPGQGDRPVPQPPVDEDFGQGHLPDYGQGGDVDRPFPGQGDRPQPQPPVDEDFGQGHLPDNGQSNGNSGEIERPRPGNGEGSVERPQPGNGQGSVERPLPGAGSSVERPMPGGDNGSNGGSGGDVERPRPVEPDNSQVHRPTPGLGGAVANNGNNIQNNANNIESNKNNIAAMGDAFQDRVDNVNGWLGQVGNGIQGNSDKIDNLAGAFQAQAAHNTKEIARLDGRIDALEEKTDKMKAGIAGAHAVASLTQYHGVGQHHVAIGIGAYDGEAAIAAGYTYAFDDKKTTIRGTLALDTENEFAVGASIGHSW